MAILLDVACSSARIQQRVRSSECGRLHPHAGGVLHAKFSIRLRPLLGKRDLQCSTLKRIGPSPRLRHCTETKDTSKSTPSTTNLTPIIGSRNTYSPILGRGSRPPSERGRAHTNMMNLLDIYTAL